MALSAENPAAGMAARMGGRGRNAGVSRYGLSAWPPRAVVSPRSACPDVFFSEHLPGGHADDDGARARTARAAGLHPCGGGGAGGKSSSLLIQQPCPFPVSIPDARVRQVEAPTKAEAHPGMVGPQASALRVRTWFQSFQPSGGVSRSVATPALAAIFPRNPA